MRRIGGGGCMARLALLMLILRMGLYSVKGQKTQQAPALRAYEQEVRLYQYALAAKDLADIGESVLVINKCNEAIDSLATGYNSRYIGYLNDYKGLAYVRSGNYFLSEKCCRLAHAYSKQFNDNVLNSSALNNLGVLELETKKYDQAKIGYHLMLNSNLIPSGDRFLHFALINLFAIAIDEKDTLEGMRLLQQIEPLLQQPDSYVLGRNIGRFFLMLNQPKKALPYFQDALAKCRAINSDQHFQTGVCYSNMGQCYEKLGLKDSAKMCYEKAERVESIKQTNLNSGLIEIVPQYETTLLDCLNNQGNLNKEDDRTLLLAYEKFSVAIGRLLFLSHAINAESSRFIIADKGRVAFNGGIYCALRLYDQTSNKKYLGQALEWSLMSRSLSINWLVEKNLAYTKAGIPTDLTRQLQKYRNMLDKFLVDSLNFVANVPLDSIGRVIRQYEKTENLIRTKYGEIRKDINEHPLITQLDMKQFQGERYLGYYDLDTMLIVFKSTPQGWSYLRIRKDDVLSSKIQRYKDLLSTPPGGVYGSREVDEFSELSTYLYEKLVKPALDGATRGRLAIHPDGILLGIPFESLTTSMVRANTFKELPYLMNRFDIRYVTTSLLTKPTYHTERAQQAISILTCHDATTIPEVTQEVEAISKGFAHPDIYYLDQTPPENIPPTFSPMIHISSHLTVNSLDPMLSGVYCREPDSSGLTFKDVLSLQLAGSQVFINTCESGNGPINQGEGLMSLGLAFSLAGCSGIIQQLWKAPDHASSVMAQSYYRYLTKKSPAGALNRAKKRFIQSSKPGEDHPYNWAGLVCYSNIPGQKDHPVTLSVLLILIITGGGAYLVFRKRNRR